MNSLENDERIYQDMGSENELDFKGYPSKGQRFIALKGTISNKYPLLSYKAQRNQETALEYDWLNEQNPITLQYFTKDTLMSRAPYSNLPQTWGGNAYLTLKHQNQTIVFKEIGTQNVGLATKPEISLELYHVPQAYRNKSTVAFIALTYGTNIGDRGGNGLYVLRKK